MHQLTFSHARNTCLVFPILNYSSAMHKEKVIILYLLVPNIFILLSNELLIFHLKETVQGTNEMRATEIAGQYH